MTAISLYKKDKHLDDDGNKVIIRKSIVAVMITDTQFSLPTFYNASIIFIHIENSSTLYVPNHVWSIIVFNHNYAIFNIYWETE